MATITELENNMSGLTFRTTLNNNLGSLNTDKVELADFNDAVDRIDTAEEDIIAAEGRLDTNEGDIEALEDRMDAAEGLLDFDHESVSNFSTTSINYVEIMNREFALSDGLYKVDMSTMFTMSVTNYSAYFRFSLDNGVTWREVIEEVKDIHDVRPLTYSFMLPVTNNTLDIRIQVRVENAAATLTVQDMNIMVDRKA